MNKELKKRIEKLNLELDEIFIFNFSSNFTDPNFFYFTNSNVFGIFSFRELKILTSQLDYSRAKKSWIKNIEILDKFENFKNKTIGIDKENISVKLFSKFKKCKIVDISKDLQKIRLTKTDYEINCIKKACQISKKIFKKIEPQISEDLTEIELKKIIEIEILRQNTEPSFSTIVASGKNVKHPHHIAKNKKLTEPILIDFGVKYKGYCSDITRTIGSKYEFFLLEILQEVYSMIEPGIKASKVDNFVRQKLKSKNFITSLGHGIGLEIHEQPWISMKSKNLLQENMTFTIEPGIYMNNGIRIENDFLLKNELKLLSDF